jgi:uncharacterized protein
MDRTEAIKKTVQYSEVVRTHFKTAKVLLFGSYATNTFTEESDIDIAIVIDEYTNLLDTQLLLMQLRRKIDSRIEPHPFKTEDFKNSNPLVNEILKYGLEF